LLAFVELAIHCIVADFDTDAESQLFRDFEHRHDAEYGRSFPESPKEIVNVRLTGTGETQKITAPAPPASGSLDDALITSRPTVFRSGTDLQSLDTAFYRRDRLPVGETIEGPAVILQQDSTTVVRPHDRFMVDTSGNILISIAV
ncbi:MAG: hydantoinase/oxoprolinase family protein, partial [Pseudomonadota bacterium]